MFELHPKANSKVNCEWCSAERFISHHYSFIQQILIDTPSCCVVSSTWNYRCSGERCRQRICHEDFKKSNLAIKNMDFRVQVQMTLKQGLGWDDAGHPTKLYKS